MCSDLAMGRDRAVALSFCHRDADPYPRDYFTGLVRPEAERDPVQWGAILRVLTDACSPWRGAISHWYYLCHPVVSNGRGSARSAVEVAEEVRAALAYRLTALERPSLEVVTWDTDRPPNDYADLYAVAAAQLRAVRTRHPRSEIVLVVSAGTPEMQAALLLAGALGIVEGPVRIVQVERNEGARKRPDRPVFDVGLEIPTVLKVARTAAAPNLPLVAPTDGYEQAASPRLKEALRVAGQAAAVPFPLLLRGERGSGKSRLATFVRAWSSHGGSRSREWPAVACGQFTDPQLMLAELCGSVKGAFTGAVDRKGLFSLADGDTFFMDEVHDLSAPGQRALMRILEDGTFYRVGSNKKESARFRLITGTNLDHEALSKSLFPDFLDRIRDIEVEVPPLRECAEDHPWMWRAAWAEVCARSALTLTLEDAEHDEVVKAIAGAHLPGNWRDLRRIAVRILVELREDRMASRRAALHALVAAVLATPDDRAPAGEARRLSAKDLGYYNRLQGELGPGLAVFWDAVREDPTSPPLVLLARHLGRDRARHAQGLIARMFPERWASAVGAKMAPRSRQRSR
jgi:sigma54-dependent transcription regulator